MQQPANRILQTVDKREKIVNSENQMLLFRVFNSVLMLVGGFKDKPI